MCTLDLFYSFVSTPAEYACFPRVYTMRADGILHRDVRQVLATVPLRARLNGRPVVAGLPVPTDDLVPVAGGPS